MEKQLFEIYLLNDRRKSYRLFAVLAVAVVFLSFAAKQAAVHFSAIGIIILIWLLLCAVQLQRTLLRNEKKLQVLGAAGFGMAIAAWIFMNNYWFAGLYVLMMIFFIQSIKQQRILVNDDQVTYPSFPEKQFAWHEIETAVIRDNYISISQKNDKFIQQKIDTQRTRIDIVKFNDFCSRKTAL